MAIDSPDDRMWGRFDYSIDDKNRVVVPQRFRDKLGADFVVTQAPSRSVRLYPMQVWKMLTAEVASKSIADELNNHAGYLQLMIGNCDFVSLDAQNRVTLPRPLKEWAQLNDEKVCAIIGAGSRVEIWLKDNWNAAQEQYSPASVTEALAARNGAAAAV